MVNIATNKVGVVEMDIPLFDIIDDIQDQPIVEKSDFINNVLELNSSYTSADPIRIGTIEEFNAIKHLVLKCNYVGVYKKDHVMSIVGDNSSYFIINTNGVPIDEISRLFIFRKPKKVIFDYNYFNFMISDGCGGLIDLKLAFKFLFNLDFDSIKPLIKQFEVIENGKFNIHFVYSYLINIAKSINIYVEKNKLNKVFFLEMDIAPLSYMVSKRGIPIDESVFNIYKENLTIEYNNLMNKKNELYGKNYDFENKKIVLKDIKGNVKTLNENLLYNYTEELLKDYLIYKNYKNLSLYTISNSALILNYDTYLDYQIKPSFKPDMSIIGDNNTALVEGKFVDLYLRIFVELSKCPDLIDATSNNVLIPYINKLLYGDNESLNIYTEIIIKAYTNNLYEPFDIQNYVIEKFDTLINVGDISAINTAFEENLPELMIFLKEFDGTDVIYERYNKVIFNPMTNLDGFIKQIMNIIYKKTVLDIDSEVTRYNTKFNKSVYIAGLFEDSILIAASSEDEIKATVSILNISMPIFYKKFIKKTNFYNTTTLINQR